MCFRNPYQVELVFFPFAYSWCGILPRPYFPLDNVFQTGYGNADFKNYTVGRIGAAVCYRVVDFNRGHLRSQVTKPRWHCQLAAPPLATALGRRGSRLSRVIPATGRWLQNLPRYVIIGD